LLEVAVDVRAHGAERRGVARVTALDLALGDHHLALEAALGVGNLLERAVTASPALVGDGACAGSGSAPAHTAGDLDEAPEAFAVRVHRSLDRAQKAGRHQCDVRDLFAGVVFTLE
jgi:hypothetical protein